MIAQQSGVAKPNIFYYFRSKAEIYDSLLTATLDDWIREMALFEQAGEGPRDKIAAYIRGKLAFSRKRPYASQVFANEIISGSPNIKQIIRVRLVPQLEKDAELVQEWVKDGKIDPVDPYHLFFMIWASTQSYADFSSQMLLVLDKEELDSEVFRAAEKTLVTIILKGIGA